MKNHFVHQFRSTVTLKIKGRNIDRFLRRMISHHIELLEIKPKKYNEIHITIYKTDYEKVLELKTIYEINIVDVHGFIKIKKVINYYKILIFFLVLSLFFIYFLTNIIFEIEIVHTDKEIRNLIKKELENNGIKELTFKKNYQQLNEIKQKILQNNRDKIEWLEIENVGIKYIIRIEEREKVEIEKEAEKRNLVAKKSGIIRKIEATEGEIVKSNYQYVQKGDIIVSGNIYLNENVMDTVSATGNVYAEVWYKVKVSYPLYYYEKKYKEKEKNVYTLKFLNQRIEILNFHPFKQKEIESKAIWNHSFLPISFVKEHQKEVEIIEQNYTKEEAIQKAKEEALKKMKRKLTSEEYVISQKNLKIEEKNSTIEIEEFFTVYENITSYEKIEGDLHAETNDP